MNRVFNLRTIILIGFYLLFGNMWVAGNSKTLTSDVITNKSVSSPVWVCPPSGCLEGPLDYTAYYPLDSNLEDASGNGHHASASGSGLTYSPGKVNNGVTGFTSGSYFTIPNLNLSQASISAWVYLDAHATQKIFRGPSNPPCLGEFMGNWESCGVSFSPFTINTWHHLAIVDGVGLYIDGDLIPASWIGGLDPSVNNVIYVGGAPYSEWLNGMVDEIKIYNRPLTATEVLALADLACPAAALHFDGANDYVAVPNSPSIVLSNQATWQCWVNLNPTSFVALFNHNTWYNANGYYINIFSGTLYYTQATGGGITQTYMSNSFPFGTWTHVTIVKDNDVVTMYINGSLVQTFGDTHANSMLSTTAPLELGKQLENQYLNGMMDEVRIWNIALTSSEIQDNYDCKLNGTESGLVALYHFDQGFNGVNNATVTQLEDATAFNNDGVLTNFALDGNTSNWVAPGAISTTPCVCTSFVTVAPGDYNNPATWGGCIPPNPIPPGTSITITFPVTNPMGSTLTNNGTIDFGPGGTLINNGTYIGNGAFSGSLINNGVVRPGNQ